MFEWKTDLSEGNRIQQNISNMTELRKNDLAYDRTLGVLGNWIDKPVGAYSAEMMSDLTQMLNEREPRVISSVETTENNGLRIVLEESEEEDE